MSNNTEVTLEINGKKAVYVEKSSIPSEISVKPSDEFYPYSLNQMYQIETPTKYFIGVLVAITDMEYVFTDCAWVRDTGRYNEFVKGKKTSSLEMEPFPSDKPVIIGRGALIAMYPLEFKIEVV